MPNVTIWPFGIQYQTPHIQCEALHAHTLHQHNTTQLFVRAAITLQLAYLLISHFILFEQRSSVLVHANIYRI